MVSTVSLKILNIHTNHYEQKKELLLWRSLSGLLNTYGTLT